MNHYYSYYPPEFKAAYVFYGYDPYIDVKNIDKNAMRAFTKIEKFLVKYFPKNKWMRVYQDFKKTLNNNDILLYGDETFFVPKAIDIYSLGMTMLQCLAISDGKFVMKKELVVALLLFIRKLIHPNSKKRINPEQALAEYKNIWKNVDKKDKTSSPMRTNKYVFPIKPVKSPFKMVDAQTLK